MDINITKMSTKGQVVIPADMREGIKEGEKLIVMKSEGRIILKKASDLDEDFIDDLEFARRTEEAYKRYERGKFIKMDFDDFMEELKKW